VTDYSFETADGSTIYAAKWEAENPKGIIQIIHGMAEHIGRYDEFARYLNRSGYIVVGADLRGHGRTAESRETLGYFADKDGWNKVINDNVVLGNLIKDENPGLPFYIIGQSMGSFILRKLIIDYPDNIDKVILLAGGDLPDFQVYSLTLLAKIQEIFISKKKQSGLINGLSFSKLNDQFKPGKTGFEWLSRDENEIIAYLEDPLCGFVATLGFFNDFAYGMKYLKKREAYIRTPKELPILFYSGSRDPLGANGKYINAISEKYKKHGCIAIDVMFNEGGHHESLHEINREEVFRILTDWIEENAEPKKKAEPPSALSAQACREES